MTRTNKRLATALLTVMILGFTLLVGGIRPLAQTDTGDQSDVIRIEIRMDSMYFQADDQAPNAPITLQAGRRYELAFINTAGIRHQAAIGRSVVRRDGQPTGYETGLLDDVPVQFAGDAWTADAPGLSKIELDSGGTLRVRFTLPENKTGEWEIGCFVPGHYPAGMHARVIVE